MFGLKKKVGKPLEKKNIKLGQVAADKETAIRMAGRILVDQGYVNEAYIDSMLQRDSELSTYIGNGCAIPHGVNEAKKEIKHSGISILQFPEGVDFDGNMAHLVVGIAGAGDEHLMILGNLAEVVEKVEIMEELKTTSDVNYVYKLFAS